LIVCQERIDRRLIIERETSIGSHSSWASSAGLQRQRRRSVSISQQWSHSTTSNAGRPGQGPNAFDIHSDLAMSRARWRSYRYILGRRLGSTDMRISSMMDVLASGDISGSPGTGSAVSIYPGTGSVGVHDGRCTKSPKTEV
jgi:hypothetical protein